MRRRRLPDGFNFHLKLIYAFLCEAVVAFVLARWKWREGLTGNLQLGAPEYIGLVVFFASLSIFFFASWFWDWYGPRRPSSKLRALHARLTASRDDSREFLLGNRDPRFIFESAYTFAEIREQLASLRIHVPDSITDSDRREVLVQLTAFASTGNIKAARRCAEDLTRTVTERRAGNN